MIAIDVRSTDSRSQRVMPLPSRSADRYVGNRRRLRLLTSTRHDVGQAGIAERAAQHGGGRGRGARPRRSGWRSSLHLLLADASACGPRMDIVDPETWSYSYPFFLFRLRQEMSRGTSRRHATGGGHDQREPSRVARQRLAARPRRGAACASSILFDTHLRMEDTAARLDDMTFALCCRTPPRRMRSA